METRMTWELALKVPSLPPSRRCCAHTQIPVGLAPLSLKMGRNRPQLPHPAHSALAPPGVPGWAHLCRMPTEQRSPHPTSHCRWAAVCPGLFTTKHRGMMTMMAMFRWGHWGTESWRTLPEGAQHWWGAGSHPSLLSSLTLSSNALAVPPSPSTLHVVPVVISLLTPFIYLQNPPAPFPLKATWIHRHTHIHIHIHIHIFTQTHRHTHTHTQTYTDTRHRHTHTHTLQKETGRHSLADPCGWNPLSSLSHIPLPRIHTQWSLQHRSSQPSWARSRNEREQVCLTEAVIPGMWLYPPV